MFERLQRLLEMPAYSSPWAERRKLFLPALQETIEHHYAACRPYARLCDSRGFDPKAWTELSEIPPLPTSTFKDTLLLSVPEGEVFREIRSSATTSGRPSRMGLDKATNLRQAKCFNKTLLERVGNQRYDFIVLDEPGSIGRSKLVSARSSTIRSMLFMAKSAETCLEETDGKLQLQAEKLHQMLGGREGRGQGLVLFGFTFILYTQVIRPLLEQGKRFDLQDTKILHIGGWKKLEAQKVNDEKLIADCCAVFGARPENIIDLYGFTEQGGLIYPTCEAGFRHTPAWGEVLVRDPYELEVVPDGKTGLLQFLSPIQTSYPGHNVLTEDLGYVVARDDCPCGRNGVAFKVIGRSAQAEVRGCGDIMAEQFA